MSKYTQIGIQCLRDEAAAVSGLIKNIDEGFDKAIELIRQSKLKTCPIFSGSSQYGSKARGMSVGAGSDVFHHGGHGHGRCFGLCTYGSPPF